ncbi:restriction endonuclease subunit S [Xanthomonadaceae bacterium JHOS43]|nr:restriction endonuclease subunit S [Xanthomonadaceae bacterium JHOS43]
MSKPVLIGDFLHRIKRPINLEPASRYKLVTVKLYHKGVVLREEKLGADIKSKMYQVKEGDFILSGIDARNGAFGIVPPELDGAVVTNDFWYFEIDDDVVDKGFFLEITSTHWFDEICRKGSDGTTQRIRLQKDKFFNQIIYLPDLSEQRRFNKKFQAIKASNKTLSSELTHQHTLLKKLRQQILQEAIQGKLTADWRAQNLDVEPASELLKRIAAEKARLVKDKKIKAQKPLPPITDEVKPFELPQGWAWCRIDDMLENKRHALKAGPFGSSLTKAMYCSSGYKVYGQEQVIKQDPKYGGYYIRQEKYDELSSCKVSSGDILISLVGTIGKLLILPDQIEQGVINPRLIKISLHKSLNAAYFDKSYSSNIIQQQLKDNASGQTMDVISIKILKSVLFPLPPLTEQQAIVAKVEKLLALCDQLETQITQNQSHAEQLMQAVLKEAFSLNREVETEAKKRKVSTDTLEAIRA